MRLYMKAFFAFSIACLINKHPVFCYIAPKIQFVNYLHILGLAPTNKREDYMSKAARSTNRWFIAVMGTVLQLTLGTIYAWSFFQKPLVTAFQWLNTQVAWAFSLAIFMIGFSAAWGGVKLPKYGPTKLAVIGAFLYGLGWILGGLALSMHSLAMLYIGYGIIGGLGLGLGYVTPIATVVKWFPDKKGLVSGMVVMGFGFGALVLSKIIAPIMIAMYGTDGPGLTKMFYSIGVILLIIALPAGASLSNPPAGYVPAGYTPPVAKKAAVSPGGSNIKELSPMECVLSARFFLMWTIFFCNIAAGIMFIGFQSPMLQDLLKLQNPNLTPPLPFWSWCHLNCHQLHL
jgi:OFA family oxalate/formate antiporter-like MFS transporter